MLNKLAGVEFYFVLGAVLFENAIVTKYKRRTLSLIFESTIRANVLSLLR